MVMSFKNIKKIMSSCEKNGNKNEHNLVTNVNFNHEYIINVK
jgi:hypothetical protein